MGAGKSVHGRIRFAGEPNQNPKDDKVGDAQPDEAEPVSGFPAHPFIKADFRWEE
jgi:hypothetical protein